MKKAEWDISQFGKLLLFGFILGVALFIVGVVLYSDIDTLLGKTLGLIKSPFILLPFFFRNKKADFLGKVPNWLVAIILFIVVFIAVAVIFQGSIFKVGAIGSQLSSLFPS